MSNFICIKCSTTENKYTKLLCKKCYNHKYYEKYYEKNKQKFLDYANKKYKENKKEYLEEMKKYYEKNKEKIKVYHENYYRKNYDKMRKGTAKYYKKHKKILNKQFYLKKKIKIENNPSLKLIENLRTRIGRAVKHHKGTKMTSSLKLLGADIDTVRQHIEIQFKEGMTWDNHGPKGWHIDHIIPCNSFDLTKEEEQKKCFHYSNFQPLWYFENIRKAATV